MKRTSSAIALVAASILGLTACGGGSDPLASDTASASASSTGGSGQPIVVGGANFSESTLLAEIYAGLGDEQRLVCRQGSLGEPRRGGQDPGQAGISDGAASGRGMLGGTGRQRHGDRG